MKRPERKSPDLATYAVLVGSKGEILDIRTHHRAPIAAVAKLKGCSYANECAFQYRAAVDALLSRERQLLSVVMAPPTLGINSWFAVVGVPLGASKDGGALFVHMDISLWIKGNTAPTPPSNKINMDLLQQAMAATLVATEARDKQGFKSNFYYEGIESLTTRQREVLHLLGLGKSNLEISEDLACSLNTVKRHVTAVLQKLKLPNRTRAAMVAHQLARE
jgi:DNA-binding CsgD family transcriptional regulator